MALMDAIRIHAFGPPENLVLEQVPDPAPGPGQVLVAAVAHGVHLLDTTLRRGEQGGPLALPRLPTVPGREVAGTVAAVGEGVDPAWAGRRVAVHLGATPDGGGYARLAVAPVENLHPVPDGLDEADALAMIGTGRMAAWTLEVAGLPIPPGADPADPWPRAPWGGRVVVVTAAAGGLGSLFVQSALAAGARVVGLASGGKAEVVRTLGDPDRLAVVDYAAPGWEAAARAAVGAGGATLLLDGVGGDLGTAAADLLADDGVLVVHGWASGSPNLYATAEPPRPLEVRAAVGPGAPHPGDMRGFQEDALALAAAGTWRVLTHRVPLAEAARAHRELEGRQTVGKVVLV